MLQNQVTSLVTTNGKVPIRVLHVDDDSSTLDISKQILMDIDCSFDIDQACCVDEAFKKLAFGHYDVVISDYEMPKKNGLQFLQELREQKNQIPFILFTGKGREEVAIKALNLGADGYYNKNGSPETVYGELCHGTRMAVTRKATEAALVEAQTLTSSIINSTKDMIWSVSADDFHLLTYNKTLSDYFLRTQNLIIKAGMTTEEIMPTEQLALRWIELNKRALKEGSFTIEYSTLKEPRVLELTFDLLKRGEQVFGIAVFGKDITERKKTDEMARKSEVRYRDLANFLPEVVFEADLTGKITFFSQRSFEITGFTPQEIEKGVNMLSFVVPEERDRAKENIKKVLSGEEREGHEYILYNKKNGVTFPAIVKTTTIISENKVAGLRGIVIDITERKNAEQAVLESEEKFRTLAEESPNMIFINHRGKVVYANKKCEEITGYHREELYSTNFNFLSLNASEYDEPLKAAFAKHAKGEEVSPYEYVLITRDGKRINAIINTKLIEYKGGKAVLGIVTDITERKKTEMNLKESHDKLELMNEKLRVVGSLSGMMFVTSFQQ